MTDRLCSAALHRLEGGAVALPRYQPSTRGIGIVHLGLGAFHRAHQAVYTDEAMNRYGGDWAITGVSLRQGAVRDALLPQDGLYTLVVAEGGQRRYRVINQEPPMMDGNESIRDLRHLGQNMAGEQDRVILGEAAHEIEKGRDLKWVEPVGGLVEQDHLRFHRDRARDHQSLLLSAGQSQGAVRESVFDLVPERGRFQ